MKASFQTLKHLFETKNRKLYKLRANGLEITIVYKVFRNVVLN